MGLWNHFHPGHDFSVQSRVVKNAVNRRHRWNFINRLKFKFVYSHIIILTADSPVISRNKKDKHRLFKGTGRGKFDVSVMQASAVYTISLDDLTTQSSDDRSHDDDFENKFDFIVKIVFLVFSTSSHNIIRIMNINILNLKIVTFYTSD